MEVKVSSHQLSVPRVHLLRAQVTHGHTLGRCYCCAVPISSFYWASTRCEKSNQPGSIHCNFPCLAAHICII